MKIENTRNQNNWVFLYWGPHYSHVKMAETVTKNFYSVKIKELGNIVSGIITAIFAPKDKNYLCEGTFYVPALLRKFGLLKRKKIITLIASPLAYYLASGKTRGIKRWLVLWLLKEVDGIVAVSEFEYKLIKSIINKPIVTAYPPMDQRLYSKLRKIKPNLNSHRIIFIGNGPDWYYKGIDLLIESFLKAKKEIPYLELYIIGKWKIKPEWQVYGVHFLGNVKSIIPYLKKSSLCVHLGRGEAFGLSVIEAMLAGVPAIVSEMTGSKEIVRQIGNKFVVKLNSKEVSEKIVEYFNISLKEKRALSKKFKSLASKFNESSSPMIFENRFRRIVG